MAEEMHPHTQGKGRGFLGWSQHPNILLAVMTQTFINMLGVGIVGPVLPLYAASFGVSTAMVGLLNSAFGIARIPINIPAGSLADRLGRKPLLVGGFLITATSALLTGLANSFGQIVFLRLFQGIGSALQMTAAMVVMADISTPQDRGRTMSFYQGALLLGTSTGPILGGFLGEHLGYRMPFFAYAFLAFCAALWAFFVVPETRALSSAKPVRGRREQPSVRFSWRDVGGLLLNPSFLLVSFVTLTTFFTRTGSQNTVLPLLGKARFGLGPAKVGYAFTTIAVMNFLTINFSGILCDRYGRKMAIVPGCFVCAMALLTYTFGHTYWHFLLSSVLLGIGTGISGPAPAAYVSDLSLPGGRGLTMGVYRTVSDLGITVGPVLLGWVSDQFSYSSALWVNSTLFLLAGLAFALWARETAPRRQPAVSPSLGE